MSHMSRPEAHRFDELSGPGIPWRVALQQRLPPLSRLFQSLAIVPLESLLSFSERLLSHFVAVSA